MISKPEGPSLWSISITFYWISDLFYVSLFGLSLESKAVKSVWRENEALPFERSPRQQLCTSEADFGENDQKFKTKSAKAQTNSSMFSSCEEPSCDWRFGPTEVWAWGVGRRGQKTANKFCCWHKDVNVTSQPAVGSPQSGPSQVGSSWLRRNIIIILLWLKELRPRSHRVTDQ